VKGMGDGMVSRKFDIKAFHKYSPFLLQSRLEKYLYANFHSAQEKPAKEREQFFAGAAAQNRDSKQHAPAPPRSGRAGASTILISLLSEHSLPRAQKDGFAREARPRLRGGADSLWRKRSPYRLPLWRAHPCQSRRKRTLRTPEAF
jgi:hypothetical protein